MVGDATVVMPDVEASERFDYGVIDTVLVPVQLGYRGGEMTFVASPPRYSRSPIRQIVVNQICRPEQTDRQPA